MNELPFCLMPYTGMLIHTDKSLAPCCCYDNRVPLGNIKDKTVYEIINDTPWENLKNEMKSNTFPEGCRSCKMNEEQSNWSLRLETRNNAARDHILSMKKYDKIAYIEFNGSNICNLGCLHCTPAYSSKWEQDYKKLMALEGGKYSYVSRLPNPNIVLERLKGVDLSELVYVMFKGGEPLLNEEVTTVLQYFKDLGILQKISVCMVTNGTVRNEKLLYLLSCARDCFITVSVDGPSDLNQYIRYGDSSLENIEGAIKYFNTLDNIVINMHTSVMVYNIFRLVEIRDWWLNMTSKYKAIKKQHIFKNIVTSPIRLRTTVLSDKTRENLIDYYTKNSTYNEFSYVLTALSQPYLGNDWHNSWVTYTHNMQGIRKNNILEVEPLLTDELRII